MGLSAHSEGGGNTHIERGGQHKMKGGGISGQEFIGFGLNRKLKLRNGHLHSLHLDTDGERGIGWMMGSR